MKTYQIELRTWKWLGCLFILSLGIWSCSDEDSPNIDIDEAGEIVGVLTAPNGTTPIPNALVYYQKGGTANAQHGANYRTAALNESFSCGTPPSAGTFVSTCTDEKGGFVLDLAGSGASGIVEINFAKGKWLGSFEVNSTGEDVGIVRFSNTASQGAPKIAVVTGSYDQIENVLIKMGMSSDPAYFETQGFSQKRQMQDPKVEALLGKLHEYSAGHIANTRPNAKSINDEGDCPPRPLKWPKDLDWPSAYLPCELFPSGFDWDMSESDNWPDWGYFFENVEWLRTSFWDPEWLGTETFDLYIGNRIYGEYGDYPSVNELFAPTDGAEPLLMDYDIVYINCNASIPFSNDWKSVLEKFVAAGGILYVTDLSSGWLTQPFPEHVQLSWGWRANIGDQVSVADEQLHAWLNEVPCKDGNCFQNEGIFTLSGFGDHVLNPLHGSVEPIVVTPEEAKPLTLLFPFDRGLAIFSTYHTSSTSFSHEYTPEERVLEYLFYEGGSQLP